MFAAILLGLLLAARSPSPAVADPPLQAEREAYLRNVAAGADAIWADLQEQLEAARDAAREGAALIVEGTDPPDVSLRLAADRLDEAGPRANEASGVENRLRGILACVRPGQQDSVPDLPTAADLASIAVQLRAAVDAAGPFLARRHAAEETLAQLEMALASLKADRLDEALQALDAAAGARQVLADWEQPPATLDLWLETTDSMIVAARDIADAAQAGDERAAKEAADAYAAAAADAHRADVSLALSLSETGAGLTSTPLRRLAEALAQAADARSEAESLQR